MSVAIVLTTYNSEKYIKEQLNSILNQSYQDFQIIIRDDGSTDSTLEILKSYTNVYNNIRLFVGKRIGLLKSFYRTLAIAKDFDYYCYAEQYDYWEPAKIERMVNKLETLDNSTPNMIFCDFDYYDKNMNFLTPGSRFKTYNFRNSLIECVSQGMTMIVNKKTRDLIVESKFEDRFYYDQLTYMICSSMGRIAYMKESLARYRKLPERTSEDAEIISYSGGLKKTKTQILYFKENFYDKVPKKNKKILDLFTKRYNVFKALRKCFYPKRFKSDIKEEISLRIKFLLGTL